MFFTQIFIQPQYFCPNHNSNINSTQFNLNWSWVSDENDFAPPTTESHHVVVVVNLSSHQNQFTIPQQQNHQNNIEDNMKENVKENLKNKLGLSCAKLS